MQEWSNACENVLKTSTVVSRRLYVRSTASLNDHLRGDSDDDDDGADEDMAQTTDQTSPQDATVTSEPASRASAAKCV